MRWYFFHLRLVVQQERLEFRLCALWTLKWNHGIYIYYSSVYFTIIIWQYFTPRSSIVWGACLRHSYIFIIYCDNILHSTYAPIYPRTPQQYARGTPRPDWGSDGDRARKKRWIVDKLFGRREINTLIFKNKLYRRI